MVGSFYINLPANWSKCIWKCRRKKNLRHYIIIYSDEHLYKHCSIGYELLAYAMQTEHYSKIQLSLNLNVRICEDPLLCCMNNIIVSNATCIQMAHLRIKTDFEWKWISEPLLDGFFICYEFSIVGAT